MLVTVSMNSAIELANMPRIPLPMAIVMILVVELASLKVGSMIPTSESVIPSKDVSAKFLTSDDLPFTRSTTLGDTHHVVKDDHARLVDVRVNYFFFFFCFSLDCGTISRGSD